MRVTSQLRRLEALYTQKQVAQMVGVSDRSLRRYKKKGFPRKIDNRLETLYNVTFKNQPTFKKIKELKKKYRPNKDNRIVKVDTNRKSKVVGTIKRKLVITGDVAFVKQTLPLLIAEIEEQPNYISHFYKVYSVSDGFWVSVSGNGDVYQVCRQTGMELAGEIEIHVYVISRL